MPFESLTERLQMTFRRLTGRGRVNEDDINEAMKEVRVSLLEADVNYKVVKSFINDVKEVALGERVMKSLTPGDQVLKICNEELIKLMGDEATPINLKREGINTILMCGLQGSGKTTHAGKLANYLRKNNDLNPLLVACDVYRPAAVNQLVTLGNQLNIPVFEMGVKENPVKIAKAGMEFAKKNGYNLVILDTAGRLHIDEELMEELVKIKEVTNPNEIMLTIDAMTGQDAVNVASSFNEQLGVTGCILSKLDSDTRGGAALSIRYVTGIPIKFIGVGEKLDQIEVFHPERMASRILGMGDVMTLIEKASEGIDEDEALKLTEKLQKGKFDYNDFLKQIKQIKKLGSLKGLLSLIPGLGSKLKNIEIDDKQFVGIEAIISSMTKQERKNPDLISKSKSRKERISVGSGRSYTEINQLTKRFDDMKSQMQAMMGMSESDMQKMAQGRNFPQMQQRPHKGKGHNKGGFRF